MTTQMNTTDAEKFATFIMPRYGAVSCGVEERKAGNLCMVSDVMKMLNYIVDVESVALERAEETLRHLRKAVK